MLPRWTSLLHTCPPGAGRRRHAVLRRRAARSEFRPFPLLGNPHVQTLLALFLPTPNLGYPSEERVVWLGDGDGLVLHDSAPPGWRPGDQVAVLLHGLSGCHASRYVVRQANLLLTSGLRVVRVDMRGSGRGLPLARGSHHAGSSGDIRAVLAEVHRWCPLSSLALVGFSLGGNIALKLAGELAEHPVPSLTRVVAVAPPVDVGLCVATLGAPRNRFYERYLVDALVTQAQDRARIFPDLVPPRFPRRVSSRLFTELYTAPRGGFASLDDYFRRTSSLPLIPRIPVPTLILTARDDPLIPVEPFEALPVPPAVEVQILPRGGHLGFLGPDGAGGIRWCEQRIAEWVLGRKPRRRAFRAVG